MNMQKLIPTLIADDMDRTIAFYRDLLGFELYEAVPDQSPYTWAVLRCGGVDVMLEARSRFLEEKEWVFLEGAPLGGTIVLYIELEGVDALYERVKDRVDIVFPLADEPYGMREFTLRDCNGYVVAFGERLQERRARRLSMNETNPTYHLYPIGTVRRSGEGTWLEIEERFRPALQQLDHFSHVIVLWWADKLDTEEHRRILDTEPPYAPGKVTGVFACRSEYRPNPIAMTTCEIQEVDQTTGIVRVVDIDAYDGTPIVDLKAYFPVCDRVREARIPEWLSDWPEWLPDEGMGL